MLSIALVTRLTLSVAAFVCLPHAAFAADATGVLKRASVAMGDGELKSIRYAGEGTGYTFGQAYKPGTPWPKINVHSQIRTIKATKDAIGTRRPLPFLKLHDGAGSLSARNPHFAVLAASCSR